MSCAIQEISSRRAYPCSTKHNPDMLRDLARRAYEYRMQVLGMVYGVVPGTSAGRSLPLKS
jgi:hypothetical protein